MKEYFNNLKPFHFFIFGTVFMLLGNTTRNNFVFEISFLSVAFVLYIFALLRYRKK